MHASVAECCPSLFVECHGELLLHSCLLLHSPIEAGAVACAAVLFSPSPALNHSCLVVCSQTVKVCVCLPRHSQHKTAQLQTVCSAADELTSGHVICLTWTRHLQLAEATACCVL